MILIDFFIFFFQAEDGIRDGHVTGVQTCALPILIVLDTNVIAEILRPSPEARVVDWLTSLTGGVAITSVTLAELLADVRRISDGRRKDSSARRIWIRTRGSRSVLPLDDLAADHCADVLVAREPAGAPISADQHGRRTDHRDLSGSWGGLRDAECQGFRTYRRRARRPVVRQRMKRPAGRVVGGRSRWHPVRSPRLSRANRPLL